ncbi:hypothetical protein C0431_15370 [bacterium]|nr:hypothetical protein [bacterium]
MKQVYRIDADGFYLEPVLVMPEKVPVEVQVPNPNYVPEIPEESTEETVDDTVIGDVVEESPVDEGGVNVNG